MMVDVEPRWKQGRKPKAPKGLARVGKKAAQDRAELAEARPVLLMRSRGRCEARISALCTGYGAHPHHIVRRSQGGTNDPDSLLWVCHACHTHIHDCPAEALVRGFLKPMGAA